MFECDECPIFKSDLASLQSKFATVVCEIEEMKSRPVLLGACKLCPTLRSELDEKNALIKSLGKVGESSPPIDCHVCPGLISDLDNLAVEKSNLENENTYLRVILSWVSASEPQLGMMIKQFKRGDGFGSVTHTRSRTLTGCMVRLARLLETLLGLHLPSVR